jgi:4-amino-4-deoxy-L-arabinose transferase-like glycosyltransferase
VNDQAKQDHWIYWAIIIVIFPALLINLGLLTFIDDESIRALVALEMDLSGNYIVPTLHGEQYYNKPPLYNWIILLFYKMFGRVDEFVARMPTIVCLLGYGATIFYFFRKHYDFRTAFITALVFITCGRVLFWDSILGLIDICFSWVVFTSFMIVYHEFERGRFWRLFFFTYLLTAAGFLLKGLPAIAFQGITLVVYFAWRRKFWKLFSAAHILNGLLCLAIIGSYYWAYSQYFPLDSLLERLLSESAKRTVVNYGWWNTVLHFFTFPFEMVYHFLPWALFIIYFIRKDILSLLQADRFITFNALIFLANIILYWTSPEVYPRYLLMHAPLIFAVYIYLHQKHREEKTWQFKTLQWLFLGACALVSLGSFAPLFIERTQGVDNLWLKTLPVAFALVGTTYLYWKNRDQYVLYLILFLLVFRVGFNFLVLPDRNDNDYGDLCRASTIEIGKTYADRKMYVYKDVFMQHTNSFYLTNARGAIVPRAYDSFEGDALYIIDEEYSRQVKYDSIDHFKGRHWRSIYDIGILKEPK